MAIKLRIRTLDGSSPDETTVLNNLCKAADDLYVLDIYRTSDGAVLTLDSEDKVNKLLSEKAQKILEANNLKAFPHERYYQERSVFINNIRGFINSYEPEEIQREITRLNNIKVVKVLKINSNYVNNSKITIKLILDSKEDAEYVTQHGISFFSIKISPMFVRKETITEIRQCFKCFSFEHFTNECKLEFGICSICSGKHNFKTCKSKDKLQCANCGGPHISIAAACPIRKKYLNEASKNVNDDVNDNGNNIPKASTSKGTEIKDNNNFPELPTKGKVPSKTNSNEDEQTQSTGSSNESNPWFKKKSRITETIDLSTPENTNQQFRTDNPNCNCHHHHQSYIPNENPESIKSNEWRVLLEIMQTYAKMKAGDNAEKYLAIMNFFLSNHGIKPLETPIIITPDKTSKSGNNSAQSQIENDIILPSLGTPPNFPSSITPDKNSHPDRELDLRLTPIPEESQEEEDHSSQSFSSSNSASSSEDSDVEVEIDSQPPSPSDSIASSVKRRRAKRTKRDSKTSSKNKGSKSPKSPSQKSKRHTSVSPSSSNLNNDNNSNSRDQESEFSSQPPCAQPNRAQRRLYESVRPKTRIKSNKHGY